MRSYSEQAVLEHPVSLPYKVTVQPDPEFAKYLSTINLSSAPEWKYELKTLPRPTGRATRVIITEYDLPAPGRLLRTTPISMTKGWSGTTTFANR